MSKKKPGNELEVAKFIFDNLGSLSLNHLGTINELANPIPQSPGFKIIKTKNDLDKIRPDSSRKKADIYLNQIGISIKQTGGSFAFNRFQRANFLDVYTHLGFTNPNQNIALTDVGVNQYHQNKLNKRNVPWQNYFAEKDFKKLLKFLMMEGSPNYGYSNHPATYILSAPKSDINRSNINLYSFNEYFDLYKNKLSLAIRRVWYGQGSDSEHKRAISLMNKPDNLPWVFNNVVGKPRSGWRNSVPKNQRKTIYCISVEKK